MDSFVCNLHLHVEFNFPLGWTCVKLALKCPSVKTWCLGGCLLFYLKFILHIKEQTASLLVICQNGDCGMELNISGCGKGQSAPQMPQSPPKIKLSFNLLIAPMTGLSSDGTTNPPV